MKSKRIISFLVIVLSSLILVACKGNEKQKGEISVSFSVDGKIINTITTDKGTTISKPSDPKLKNFEFNGWYTQEVGGVSWVFDVNIVNENRTLYARWKNEETKKVNQIIYKNEVITLDKKHLYINETLKTNELTEYTFTNLQDAISYAESATEDNRLYIYLEPSVYWTSDPDDETIYTKETGLIGLTMPQENLSLIGLDDNPENTIIASNRGQMAGAIGNYNTLAIAHGFNSDGITFANYCNVDLVYPLDTSKNREKRSDTITQAQVITKANSEPMDKWIFKNSRFVSFLNVFSRSDEPHRVYYENCYFQATDDAIGTGDINVFVNSHFKLYSNHPSGSASNILQAYLGSTFEIEFKNPESKSTLFFAKHNNNFVLIDNTFTGNATQFEWTDTVDVDTRHYVHNNTFNGKPLVVSASKSETSVHLTDEMLKAYKIGNTYNVYNLLSGDDNWDPANQKDLFKDELYISHAELLADKTVIDAEKDEILEIKLDLFPNSRNLGTVEWLVDENAVEVISKTNNKIVIKGINSTSRTIKTRIKAILPSGYEAIKTIEILSELLEAPTFKETPTLKIENGTAEVSYKLDMSNDFDDHSIITWYKVKDGRKTEIAVTRFNQPLKVYELTKGEVGYYLEVEVEGKHHSSYPQEKVTIESRTILESDVTSDIIETDFSHISTKRQDEIIDNTWYLDTYRPVDLGSEFKWDPDQENSWEYNKGSHGAASLYGLMTTGRGARLLYNQSGSYNDMKVTLALTPHKTAGQGFGSATGQYMDIYIKYDAHTQTGYGVRIERTPDHTDAVKFTLYQFINGVGTALKEGMFTTAFMPNAKVELSVIGNILSVKATTQTEQSASQKEKGLSPEVNISVEITGNNFGGFGVQHTGTVSSGNRTMLESVKIEATKNN
ncbi:conserved hypothetical protein [Alteracholeplasma palmae J233]|uniref:Uncharacterized protein n=1 Tax=Alteracholeplasma palmae (strain ATCC 49389 / J233) TaxID=1318466 RepID=U4KQT8_ALTPJ|nr:InlB B-repeat-containing protein [Alteracholeplasma palmae]CCV63596.1 conserved hypothetical protein [Alteracholeplasma palmae J233]